MDDKLNRLLDSLLAGAPVNGSTSETCAVGLAAERHDLLPAPYDRPGEAWRRLNDQQRAWVRKINPEWAEHVAELAQYGETAWH